MVMVNRINRKSSYKGLTEAQVRVLAILAGVIGLRGRSTVTRLASISDTEYVTQVIGETTLSRNDHRHSLLSLGFILKRDDAIAITDDGRQFLAGLNL